jgi:hypothetical protein
VKAPGFELGLAKKLQSTPLSINTLSASIPLIVGQNHLQLSRFYQRKASYPVGLEKSLFNNKKNKQILTVAV